MRTDAKHFPFEVSADKSGKAQIVVDVGDERKSFSPEEISVRWSAWFPGGVSNFVQVYIFHEIFFEMGKIHS